MYIMIVARGYPTEKYKGNGIFEFDQAKALAKAGCKVVYAAVDIRSIRRWRKWGIESFEQDGVQVRAINIPCGRIPEILKHKVAYIGLKKLYDLIIQEFGKPDVLHAHFTGIGYVAAKLKQQIHIPLVITEHSSLLMKTSLDKKLMNIADYAYRKADIVIAVSPALANVIENNFNIKPLYLPNIVDTSVFYYAPRRECNKFNFVSAGSLIYRKRMDLTIEAFGRAFGDSKDVTLTIFGEGNERTKLEDLIKKYKLENRVSLMGMVSRKDIAKKMRECDCFVLASRAETFGVVYIEALASGIPVIATKCGGPEGFVHEGNGIMIPVDDVDALASAMKFMYENKNLYDRRIIANETQKKFSPESVANHLISIYKKII